MGELIPVENYTVAETAIDYLKNNGGGRAKFIPLNKIRNYDTVKPKSASGFVGYAEDVLTYPDEYKQIVKLLLGGVAVFNSRENAININGDWDRVTRVTLDGFVLNPLGIMSGGRAGSGVFGRRQDLKEINETLVKLDSEIKATESNLQQKQEELNGLSNDQSENKTNYARLEDEKNKVNAELSQLRFNFQEKEHKYSQAVNEAEQLKRDIEYYTTKITTQSEELNKLTSELNSSEETVQASSNTVNVVEREVREIESKLNKTRIKNVEFEGMIARINSEMNHGLEIIEEAQRLIQINNENIERFENTIEKSKFDNEKLKASLDILFVDRDRLKNELLKIDGEINELTSNFTSFENEVSSKRKYKEQKLEELHKLDVEFIELDSNRNAVIDRVRMEFGISNIEPKPLDQDEDMQDLTANAEKIRDEMKRMEPVNLLAAEDYERENDRLSFLLRQRDDLLEAKSSLVEAISKINITAEQRFNDTFETIRSNFQYVFETLFEGGEANVRLEDETNPLESPIRIMARPGGKKMLSVTQLSGGERALTAISLLFSIYLVKPSPFCILDEVDAPLDDVNLGRFLKLIKNFSENTQFIIITHNKLSMEASDILYGVTMENPGVSKVVSVKFGDNGDGNGNGYTG
jgi:chromosome segregation protein